MASAQEKSTNPFLAFLRDRKSRKASPQPDPPKTEEAPAVSHAAAQAASFTVPPGLLSFRHSWRQDCSMEESDGNFRSFLYSTELLLPEEFNACFRRAALLLENRLAERPVSEEGKAAPLDGCALVLLSEDQVRAWILLIPPVDGGQEVTLDGIRSALKEQNVVHGVHEKLLETMAGERSYFRLALAAEGTAPGRGKDGWIEEVIPSTAGQPYVDQADGSIDYKNLNWIIQVKEKDVLCRVHPPEEGAEGKTVTGAALKGRNGSRAVVPEGSNTLYDQESQAVVAKTDGQVFYEGGRYQVRQMLSIQGDVDLSTGNLEVTGNVRICGNVREGFTVRTSGDINVDGMAEGAILIAGGNIFVGNGMTGNTRGRMEAGGNITCRYMENCKASARGDVHASSAVNSTIVCEGEVNVSGTIVGGSVTAVSLIKAKTIGNKTGRSTLLILGRSARQTEERQNLAESLEEAGKLVNKLQGQLKQLREAPSNTQILAAIKSVQASLAEAREKEENLRKELSEAKDEELKMSSSQVQAEVLYPGCQVTIGTISRPFFDDLRHCRIYKSEGEICIGTL